VRNEDPGQGGHDSSSSLVSLLFKFSLSISIWRELRRQENSQLSAPPAPARAPQTEQVYWPQRSLTLLEPISISLTSWPSFVLLVARVDLEYFSFAARPARVDLEESVVLAHVGTAVSLER
jgi:hypothetical protein